MASGVYAYDSERERRWSLEFGKESVADGFEATCIAATNDGQAIAFGTSRGGVYIVRPDDTKSACVKFPPQQVAITAIAFSESGRRLAVGDAAGQIVIFDTASNECVFRSARGEVPITANLTAREALLLYYDRLVLASLTNVTTATSIPLARGFVRRDMARVGPLAVVLTMPPSEQSHDEEHVQFLEIVDLRHSRLVLTMALPTSRWPFERIGLNADATSCRVVLSSAERCVSLPLLYFTEDADAFVLPPSASRKERTMSVLRMGQDLPPLSCGIFALTPDGRSLICSYADNMAHPNVAGELRWWNMETGNYSGTLQLQSSVDALGVIDTDTVIVGTEHGEACAFRFDGNWCLRGRVVHPVAVVAIAGFGARTVCSASRDGLILVWSADDAA